MKKLLTLLFMSTLMLTSCSNDGEMGPQGPPGEDGLDGLGYTFEQTVDLDYIAETGYYSSVLFFPEEVESFDSDAVLVYRLEVLEDADGTFDAWSLIPQNFFLEEGTIQYVYNHTATSVEVILDGNFDLSDLNTGFTEDQTFRVVVVPSADIQSLNLDTSDLNAVMKAFDLQEFQNK